MYTQKEKTLSMTNKLSKKYINEIIMELVILTILFSGVFIYFIFILKFHFFSPPTIIGLIGVAILLVSIYPEIWNIPIKVILSSEFVKIEYKYKNKEIFWREIKEFKDIRKKAYMISYIQLNDGERIYLSYIDEEIREKILNEFNNWKNKNIGVNAHELKPKP